MPCAGGRGVHLVTCSQELPCSEGVAGVDTAVLQTYISRPLTLRGHKFDLRLYVLVTRSAGQIFSSSVSRYFPCAACVRWWPTCTRTGWRGSPRSSTPATPTPPASTAYTSPTPPSTRWLEIFKYTENIYFLCTLHRTTPVTTAGCRAVVTRTAGTCGAWPRSGGSSPRSGGWTGTGCGRGWWTPSGGAREWQH